MSNKYFTIATPTTRDDIVLYENAPVKKNEPFYFCWVDVDGIVRDHEDTIPPVLTQNKDESMVWTDKGEAQKAADVLNRKMDSVDFAVVKL